MTRRALLLATFLPLSGADRAGNKHYQEFRRAWDRLQADEQVLADAYNAAMQSDRKNTVSATLAKAWQQYAYQSIPEMLHAGVQAMNAIGRGE